MTAFSQLVFAGSYGTAGQAGVRAFAFDPATGALKACGEHRGVEAPSFVAGHPSGRWVYAVAETGLASHGAAGQVHALAVHYAGETVSFRSLNAQPSGGDWPCHLTIDARGQWLLATNYRTGSVTLFPIQADGSLGAPAAFAQHTGHGTHPERQEGPHAHSSIFTPDGAYVIVADLGIEALVIYRLAEGALNRAAQVPTAPGAGPRHLAFHPNRHVLYVANELNSTLAAYDYALGGLSLRETLSVLPPGGAARPRNLAADVHVTPAGDRVYVSNRGHNSLAVFAATPEGALTQLTVADCGGGWPRNFALSPEGRFILVANQNSGEIVTLPRQPGGGEVGLPVARTEMPAVSCVVFAPEPEEG